MSIRKEAGAYEDRSHRPAVVSPSVEEAIGFVLGLVVAAFVLSLLSAIMR